MRKWDDLAVWNYIEEMMRAPEYSASYQEGYWYAAADIAELAREDRTLISFLVSTIRCGESLSADDDEWISARMDKLKALAKEGG